MTVLKCFLQGASLSSTAMLQVQDVGGIVERLLGFLETGRDFVTAEAIIQLKDLLRRYPAIAEASLSSVSNITPEVSPWKCFCQPCLHCISHFYAC